MDLAPRHASSAAAPATGTDFFDVAEKRRSIRSYERTSVEPAKIDSILLAVRLAPSAGNLQAFDIVVIEDAATKRALAAAAHGQDFLTKASIVLAFCANPGRNKDRYGERGATLYCIQDATIAAAYAQLAASALGLASCWVGAFDEVAVAQVLRAPPPIRPVALIALGYGAESPERPRRRPLDDLIRHGHF